MKHTHYNSNNQDYVYTNNTAVGQNVFVTGTGGGGNINTSYYESGHARYFHQGSVGVSLQIFLDSTLLETISGGSGNITSLQDQYIHARNENHRSKYKCGFLWSKTCWRDNWVQIWEWGHRRRNATHRQEGETKSFVVNVPPSSSIRVKFVGSSDNIHKGVVSISLLESYNQSVPLADIDFDRLPQDVFTPPTSEVSGAEQQTEPLPETPELPEVQEPLPEVEVPEVEPSLETPEVDSSENAENTEQETLPTLSREQILAYQSFLGDFMQFFTQNQNQKITENMTFLDYYNANKSEANEPYESFLNSQLMANGGSIIMRDFLADFMQSTESELVEFFANMPQTQHKDGDLLDLSYFELIGLLGEQGEDSSQEPQYSIKMEMRAEARKLAEAMQSYQTFLNQNQATTITYNSHFLPQYNGTPIPYRLVIMGRYQMAYDEFVNTAMLSTIAYKQFWQELPTTPNNDYERDLKACGMLELDSVIHKFLLELNYPQLLEIANI